MDLTILQDLLQTNGASMDSYIQLKQKEMGQNSLVEVPEENVQDPPGAPERLGMTLNMGGVPIQIA